MGDSNGAVMERGFVFLCGFARAGVVCDLFPCAGRVAALGSFA